MPDSAMDNLTHTLACVALARAGGKRLGPYATGLLVVAGNSPDVDAVSRITSTANYLQHHRGITHSLAAAPVLALAVVGLFLLGRRLARSERPFGFWRAYLVALAGVVLGHLALDFCTSYRMRLLAPFSWRWVGADAIPIIDLWLLVVLIAGLTLPAFFRLISEEIGAGKTTGRGGAMFALAFLLVWFVFRFVCNARAVATLESHTYNGSEPRRTAAFASFTNPFRWQGVVETSQAWEMAEVNLLDEFDPERARTYNFPEPSPALEAARRTDTARIFLDFALFPYSYVETLEDGYLVVMRDLRFQFGADGRKGFVAEFRLDKNLAVVEERFQFRSSRPVR